MCYVSSRPRICLILKLIFSFYFYFIYFRFPAHRARGDELPLCQGPEPATSMGKSAKMMLTYNLPSNLSSIILRNYF
jgi:hypothetical protein